MEYNFIGMEKRDHRAILTLNRPEVMNAIKPEMIQELQGVLDAFFSDEETRVIILSEVHGEMTEWAAQTNLNPRGRC